MKYYFSLKFECLFVLFALPLSLFAQDRANSIEFTPQISLGLFSAHGNKINGTAFGGELIYHFATPSDPKKWVKQLKLRSIDFVFNYKNMGNIVCVAQPSVSGLGNSYAILGALNLPLFTEKKIALNFSPGFGLLYSDETWFTNQNPIIGSHINFASRAALKLVTSFGPSTEISAAIDILHYSNAGVRVPNNGMNVSSLSLGLVKHLNPLQKQIVDSSYKINYNKHSVDLGINIGQRGVYHRKNGLYKTGIYVGYNYRLNEIFGLSGGVDAIYYATVFNPDRFVETYQSKATSFDKWRIGLATGPDLWMGNLALMIKYGYYLYYNSYQPIHTYWTAGMKYHFSTWAAVQAKIYVHQTEADFVGFGILFSQ